MLRGLLGNISKYGLTFPLLLILLLGFGTPPIKAQVATEMGQEISYEFLAKLIETASRNYPNSKAFDARIQIAEKGIKKSKLSYGDIFSFSYFFNPNQTAAGLNPNMLMGYQLGIFANIGAIIQKPTQIKQAKDELKVVQFEKETYLLNLEAEVKKRYFEYAKSKAMYRVVSQSCLDAESRLEDVRHRFEKGELTYESYNNALFDLSNRLQTKISAESDVLIAKASLEELLGQPLEDIK